MKKQFQIDIPEEILQEINNKVKKYGSKSKKINDTLNYILKRKK